jgi:hypothetical protein
MAKAAAVASAVMFVMVLILAASLSPLCAVCVPLLGGPLAGYLTGIWERDPGRVVGRGAMAGAIAGAVAILAQFAAAVINSLVMQNPEWQLNPLLGLPVASPEVVWVGQLGIACGLGLLNIGVAAGLGAAGAALWKSTAGKDTTPTPPAASP